MSGLQGAELDGNPVSRGNWEDKLFFSRTFHREMGKTFPFDFDFDFVYFSFTTVMDNMILLAQLQIKITNKL